MNELGRRFAIFSNKSFVNPFRLCTVKVYQTDELFYLDCVVPIPEKIGDGVCNTVPYNTEACSFDGGDCGKPKQGSDPLFPDCYVPEPFYLGDGQCNDNLPYNTEKCNFDGGDCSGPKPVEGYPNCFVLRPESIGNNICNEALLYNSLVCGFDGGEC